MSAIIVPGSFFICFIFVFMRFSFCWLRIAEISRQIGEILSVVRIRTDQSRPTPTGMSIVL